MKICIVSDSHDRAEALERAVRDSAAQGAAAVIHCKVRVLREPKKGVISWKIRYRDGRLKEFTFPIRTTPWGSIKAPQEVAPSYINPLQGLQRLEKIMDEYVGGYSMFYVTSDSLLNRALELLQMLTEDFEHIGAEDLHQLQRAWELQHRILTAESVTRHTQFRQETRWPGYYYRGDYPKLDDTQWHCFTGSQYDPKSREWKMSKLPVHRIVEGFELLRA